MVAAEAELEATGFNGGRGGRGGSLSTGYKLVPWSSWDQWCYVRDGLFSRFPAAALRRIAAWRSRGCLPTPVDVTAAFIEIRQKDPFFRSEMIGNDALESEEMLAMLYSMAIMRLINGFVENPHKKTGHSISELAEAAGIPRVLVDIRHESSHRSLPSLRLLRLAAIKALDWLKCIYWDPQTSAIPDARVELRSTLCEIAHSLKAADSKKSRSGSKRNRSEKLISKTIKYVLRLYRVCPSEVVSVLLDFFQLDALELFVSSDSVDMQQTDSLDANHLSDAQMSNSDTKTIIEKLSQKEPRLLLGILKTLLEMVETGEALENKGESRVFQTRTEPCKMKNLCFLVLWLVTNLKKLKDSGCIGLVHEIGVLSSDRNALPRFCLKKLLQKCLSLSILGERYLIDASLLLLEMINNDNVKEKLRKLPTLSLQSRPPEDSTLLAPPRNMPEEEYSVEKATEKLAMFKLLSKKRKKAALVDNDTTIKISESENSNRWTVTKSWTPCPIGTLPCSYSSTAVLPVLDVIDSEQKDDRPENHGNFTHDGYTESPSDFHPHPEQQLDDQGVLKRSRPSPDDDGNDETSDMPELSSPLKGRLLVGGVWTKASKEELNVLKSKLKISF